MTIHSARVTRAHTAHSTAGSLHAAKHRLRQRLGQKEEENVALRQENGTLQGNLAQTQVDLHAAQQRITEQGTAIDRLTQELVAVREERGALQGQVQEGRSALARLQAAIGQLQLELQASRAAEAMATARAAEEIRQRMEAQRDLVARAARISELEAQVANVRAELAASGAERAQLLVQRNFHRNNAHAYQQQAAVAEEQRGKVEWVARKAINALAKFVGHREARRYVFYHSRGYLAHTGTPISADTLAAVGSLFSHKTMNVATLDTERGDGRLPAPLYPSGYWVSKLTRVGTHPDANRITMAMRNDLRANA